MGQVQIKLDYTSLDPECGGQRYWYAFLMSSLITFFGGILLIYFWRMFRLLFFSNLRQKLKACFCHVIIILNSYTDSCLFILFLIEIFRSKRRRERQTNPYSTINSS
jgi:hypothetical protein